MKLQPHTLAQKCPLVCDCLGSLWIGLVAVTVTFRNSDKTLALEVQNADCEVFVLVKFWFCRAIDFLFGFCDFLDDYLVLLFFCHKLRKAAGEGMERGYWFSNEASRMTYDNWCF